MIGPTEDHSAKDRIGPNPPTILQRRDSAHSIVNLKFYINSAIDKDEIHVLVLNRGENFFKSQWNDLEGVSRDFGGQILGRGPPHFHTQLGTPFCQHANLDLVIFCRNSHAKDRSIKQCQTWEQDKIPFHFPPPHREQLARVLATTPVNRSPDILFIAFPPFCAWFSPTMKSP
ncbi:hypothetical protein ES708_21827 [subsurface metagenome]